MFARAGSSGQEFWLPLVKPCVGCLPCACSCASKDTILALGVCLVHALVHARAHYLRWVFALCMLLRMQGLNTCVGCLPCACSCACKGSILALGVCLVDALVHARLNTCVGCLPCACSLHARAQYLRWVFALWMLLRMQGSILALDVCLVHALVRARYSDHGDFVVWPNFGLGV